MNYHRDASGSVVGQTSRMWRILALALLYLVQACGEDTGEVDAQSAEMPPLASFEALYDLSLNRANSGSGIESYAGLLTIRWAETCEGYTSDQQIAADIWNVTGGQVYTEFSSSSWEARNQTLFRFTMRTKLNEEVSREVRGKANRDKDGEDGTIIFSKPKEAEHVLDPAVLFPSEYANRLIKAAREGETVFRANMFDGSDDKIIFDTVSFIGQKGNNDDSEDETEQHSLLAGLDYWPVQASYHPTKTKDELPDFEISMRMYANGVTTDLVLDYGDFALNGKLLKLKEIDGGGC